MQAKGKRSLNFFPVQLSSKNRHITLDTTTLAQLFYPPDGPGLMSVGLKHGGLLNTGYLKANAHLLWFRTEAKCFNAMKDYVFSDMIVMDGVSCGIVYMREDIWLERTKTKAAQNLWKAMNKKKEPYTDELSGKGHKEVIAVTQTCGT